MPHLHRILYRSDAAFLTSSEDAMRQVRHIVDVSQARNVASGLTGALLLSAGVFIQALEGPLEAIEDTFERICRDLRHRRVRLLELAAAEQRTFGEWSMAQITPTRQLARIGSGVDGVAGAQIDAVSASAIIELMRSLLLVGTTAEQGTGTR